MSFIRPKTLTASAITYVLLGTATTAAQGLDSLGSRASALGAFVAVADDASAVAWNPAGMVTGPIFNILFGLDHFGAQPDQPPSDATGQAGRLGTTLLALGVPPLGISYYRLREANIEPLSPAVAETPGRENNQVVLRTLQTSHLGATVLQSIGDYLTVGATVKLVRGSVAGEVVEIGSWDEGFDRAETLEERGTTRGDLDLGAMLAVGRMRAGLVVRNVTEPSFKSAQDDGLEMSLERHARLGFAWGDRWPGTPRTIVAFDVDLTRVPHPAGERRDIAAGAERWLRGSRWGIRGGVRASTVGDARPIASGGLSFAIRSGTYVDGHIAGGSEAHSWGIAARVTY